MQKEMFLNKLESRVEL